MTQHQPADVTAPAPSVEADVVRRIDAAAVRGSPFPHIFVNSIFPTDFYREMLSQIPAREFYKAISETGRTSGGYEERLILHLSHLDDVPSEQRTFWRALSDWFVGSKLAGALARKFAPVIAANAGRKPETLSYSVEAMLVKDLDGYRIGPHTDIRSRAVSVMFYLPRDDSYARFGTTLYRPRDPGFRSDGSRHFEFEDFTKFKTMPCRPNSIFGFARSDTSFHGVEPIESPDIERDVLLYVLRWK